jgi:hypothetical protein
VLGWQLLAITDKTLCVEIQVGTIVNRTLMLFQFLLCSGRSVVILALEVAFGLLVDFEGIAGPERQFG